jgi:hypothetical protein
VKHFEDADEAPLRGNLVGGAAEHSGRKVTTSGRLGAQNGLTQST